MSPAIVGAAGFLCVLVLIMAGLPVAVAMGAIGVAGFWWLNGWSGAAFILGSSPFQAIFPYSLSVVPLFVMMGVFSARSGLSRSLFDAVTGFLGHRRGGLAMTSIGACALFGAICGSSLATVATMGRVAVPEMDARGYDTSLAASSVAAGATLGVLIPPSILLIIYGILTETSIGQLFLAGIIPGLIGAGLYMAAIAIRLRLAPGQAPPTERMRWRDRMIVLQRVWRVLALFLLVIGGIYIGVFSPTEAAAVGAIGAIGLSLASHEASIKMVMGAVKETATITGMIFFILIGASLFNYFLESSGLPHAIIGWVDALGLSANEVLVLVLVFYICLGCLMDSLSMILLTIPFVAPLAQSMDFNMVWFGILAVTVAEIALITPPVGLNLFVMQSTVPTITQQSLVRGIVPFIIADIVRLTLLASLPVLALWLPSTMFGN